MLLSQILIITNFIYIFLDFSVSRS